MKGKFSIFLLLAFAVSSCFGGVEKRGSVKGYKSGTGRTGSAGRAFGIVATEGGSFRVGSLPAEWIRKNFSYRAILFTHAQKNRTITVDAFCKGSFDDAPLKVLTNQLLYNVTAQKQRMQKDLMLDGREALRTVVSGKVDGASVILDTVVLKMNECVFDFVYVSQPGDYEGGRFDFENFYRGFKYIRGPEID
ncbi:MAG: hypothetical protein HY541_09565 [Deltaproteobacteria bacterium]|nr:hypothetical protein [Deltaproteobacteria bacterium]